MRNEPILASRPEILHYMVVRLLNFRRIDHSLFCELICERFGLRTVEPLFDELVETGGVQLCNQMILVSEEEVLQQHLLPSSLLVEYLHSEEALN